MKKIVSIGIVFSSLFLLIACDDVLEEDITDDLVTTVAPKDKSNLDGNSVQFRWDELQDADDYRIQVIEETTQKRVLDSLVKGNSFTYGLNPGEYSWRIRGENFAYTTAYSFPISFALAVSDDLTNQTVFLTSPSENFYTKDSNSIILTWDRIQAAKSYTVIVEKTLQNSTSTEINTPGVTNNDFTLNSSVLSEDAIYTWKVKAINDSGETKFSTRKIFLDTQVPNQPTLASPNNDAKGSSPITFTWNIASDTGEVQSTLSSIIEVAKDNGFTNIIETVPTSSTSQAITFSNKGDYYWRVKIIDKAGNSSTFSEVRKITVE
ncbi:hypothetical protein ATE84_2663 [Aquimarina sp. MAR_2010_214]|uniref:fibronectin type III domain-containing protein n=1 Tax=Aquimarina sp. MAR_2010_214 TaxID=1250026 RepID=UPI000C7030A0|nr:fibronectin type III domain-containing protein [Aquimarina sp. MAR_2010_214]PKV50601.1 hypothetical protein ATE84_2663 [Aquimarina sp. MAR_2010_214]